MAASHKLALERQKRDAGARSDQRGIYLQDDLLQDISILLDEVRGALSAAETCVLSDEGKERLVAGKPLQSGDLSGEVWMQHSPAAKVASDRMAEVVRIIDARRAELSVLATAESREEKRLSAVEAIQPGVSGAQQAAAAALQPGPADAGRSASASSSVKSLPSEKAAAKTK